MAVLKNYNNTKFDQSVDIVSKWPTRLEQLSLLMGQILSPGAMLASQLTSAGGALASQIKQHSEREGGEPEAAAAEAAPAEAAAPSEPAFCGTNRR